ncbi:MAG: glycosyltransferase family 4 protein [Thermoplasmata archaeon]
MRVVLVGTGMRPIPPVGYGGVERTVTELAVALRASGDEVDVVHEVHPYRAGEIVFALRLGRYRDRLARGVVHAHTPVVARRLHRMGVPYVYTTHSRHWFVRRGWTQRRGFRLERMAVAHAAATIALTPAVHRAIDLAMGGIPRGLEVTIPLGVDLKRFFPRGELGEPQTALGVGAVVPVKRWEIAAAALEGTGIRLRLVGPITDRSYAEAVRKAGPVDLLGEIPDDRLLGEFARAALLVHPSAVELFPGAVAQALACGRPVVGGPPIAGTVGEGDGAWIVPPADRAAEVLAYRDRIVALCADPEGRARAGRAARRYAEEHFDWQAVARAHRAVYARVGLSGTAGGD